MLKKLLNKDEKESSMNQSEDIEVIKKFISKPKICMFDFDEEVYSLLKREGFNVTEATLGSPIKVPNNSLYDLNFCLPNHDIPNNIHEFDVIFINLSDKETVPYNEEEHFKKEVKNNVTYVFASKYPQKILDPRPFSSHILSDKISNDSIIIVFASHEETQEYFIAEINSNGNRVKETVKYSNYSFLRNAYHSENLYGEEINVTIDRNDLRNLLQRHLDKFYYESVFYHPEEYKEGTMVERNGFFPLLQNKNGGIVSYIDLEKNPVFMLPQISDKLKIIKPFLEEILPDIFPDKFPYSTRFAWKENEEYWLPNHKNLISKKGEIEIKYKKNIDEINEQIKSNYDTYSFLHKLITETGDELVKAVKKYLEWLGLKKVKEMDENNDGIKEEDLQVELEEELLVIEIKGIGGTSKDSDCNQIEKIKFRRAKERNRFDVYGLYIVNHQRYLPPQKRENPPFTPEQILDAENQERGLLTTWELFKAYYLIQDKIIDKEEIRQKLLNYGLIELSPNNLKYIYNVKEIFNQQDVFIMELDNIEIKLGDELIIFRDDNYTKAKILNLQKDDKDVEKAFNGEIGIKIDKKIKKNSEVYIRN